MDTFLIVLAGFGLFFLLLMLLLLSALFAGGSRSYRHESDLPALDSQPRQPSRGGFPLWQLLLAVVFLCFTSEPADDRYD